MSKLDSLNYNLKLLDKLKSRGKISSTKHKLLKTFTKFSPFQIAGFQKGNVVDEQSQIVGLQLANASKIQQTQIFGAQRGNNVKQQTQIFGTQKVNKAKLQEQLLGIQVGKTLLKQFQLVGLEFAQNVNKQFSILFYAGLVRLQRNNFQYCDYCELMNLINK